MHRAPLLSPLRLDEYREQVFPDRDSRVSHTSSVTHTQAFHTLEYDTNQHTKTTSTSSSHHTHILFRSLPPRSTMFCTHWPTSVFPDTAFERAEATQSI